MTCSDFEKDILLNETGELSARRRDPLTRHLFQCPACRAFQADLRHLQQQGHTRSLAGGPVPPENVMRTIRAAAANRPVKGYAPAFRSPRALVRLAAGLALVFGVWRVATHQPPPMPRNEDRAARISEVSSLLMALTENGEEQIGSPEPVPAHAALKSLATQLLILQDMSVDLPEDATDSPTTPEEHLPTTLQWHSTPGARSTGYG
jgi:hypothetical protein